MGVSSKECFGNSERTSERVTRHVCYTRYTVSTKVPCTDIQSMFVNCMIKLCNAVLVKDSVSCLFLCLLIRNLPQLRERGTVHPIANSTYGEERKEHHRMAKGKGMQVK